MAHQSTLWKLALGATLLAAAGCDPPFTTAQGQLGLESGELFWDSATENTVDAPVIAGSHYCPEIRGWYSPDGEFQDDESVASCFDVGAGGSATLDAEGCILFDAAGDARVEFIPRTCSVGLFVRDSLPFRSIEPDAAELRFDAMWLRGDIGSSSPFRPLAPGVVPTRGTEIAVASGVEVVLTAALFERNTGALASWNHGPFSLVPVAGEPELLPFSEDAALNMLLETYAWGVVRMVEGDGVQFQYRASGTDFESQQVIGASTVAQAASLELVAFYAGDEGDRGPRSVHAIIDDELGRRVVGAPVVWTVEGEHVWVADEPDDIDDLGRVLRAPDRLELGHDCADSTNRGTVVAAYGELRAELDLEWDCGEASADDDWDDDDGEPWDDDGDDGDDDDGPFGLGVGGCACNSGDAGGGAPWLVLLGVLLAGLRRRRRRRVAAVL